MDKIALYPGTFDPIHNGHVDIIRRAAELFDRLIVGVYTHNRPIKTPLFSAEQRVEMVRNVIGAQTNIEVTTFSGLTVDFAKSTSARILVRGLRVFSDFEFEFRISLANQRMYPDIEHVCLMSQEQHMFISSSLVREIASLQGDISSMVPGPVGTALAARYAQ